ncbi:7-carboxy-7-deazaguanine synthase QueE [Mucilaginibacter sp. JRF]|uniref:7-carboxy-7-deazaguanine synthase QueE n=1 Tax=Mucilaginibacter sp. JRF TaxID=2780088 RepID=UPI001882B1B5|nr:7-carboxy-7-deazaguanine synthase QueE [Mucilaginibacter sp. JRF]MBE9586817.1 7-carboxy-7-deazaguanine synthase QueE [Mucilaginibacter sp. JRF]
MAHQIPDDGTLLPLMEEFYTIQGEGYNTGKAAYFIRLGGCDVGCHWCDVKESWDAELHALTAADTLVEHASKHPAKNVVVTGGEPLIYNLDYLTAQLQASGIRTFIETSGAYPLSGKWDWICLSPKKFKAPSPDVATMADELKVIIFNKSDFEFAEKNALTVSPDCKLFLQPEWSRAKEMTPLIVDYVMSNPKWEISLQTHKFLNIP